MMLWFLDYFLSVPFLPLCTKVCWLSSDTTAERQEGTLSAYKGARDQERRRGVTTNSHKSIVGIVMEVHTT
jgi:hypothetical protein